MFEGAYMAGAGDDISHSTARLAHHLRDRGHQVNTLDMAEGPYDAVIFSDHPTLLNARFRELRRTKTKLYLFLMENEINRPDNYWRWNHREFEKVFTWNPRLVDNKKYIQFFHTVKIPEDFRVDLSKKNKFCVLVSSQKYSTRKGNLYTERLEIIRWFEREHPRQFDLYGQRWDRFYISNWMYPLNLPLSRLYLRFPKRFATHRFPSYLGPVARKRDVMQHYKFAIVYENAVVPGYLTEKIFDAFFAGCVPVYLGAPDITDYIPAETFVDRREFVSNEQMYRYLEDMSDKDYRRRINAIEEFVNGDRIKRFGSDQFIDLFVRHIVNR